MLAALVDTSAMVSAFGLNQPRRAHYQALLKLATEENWSLATTWPCIVEVSFLLMPPQRFSALRWVEAGSVSVFPFAQDALGPMIELMLRYTELPRSQMDLADASLVWLAADTNVTRIMTLDVRGFSRYRLPDGRAFEIL